MFGCQEGFVDQMWNLVRLDKDLVLILRETEVAEHLDIILMTWKDESVLVFSDFYPKHPTKAFIQSGRLRGRTCLTNAVYLMEHDIRLPG